MQAQWWHWYFWQLLWHGISHLDCVHRFKWLKDIKEFYVHRQNIRGIAYLQNFECNEHNKRHSNPNWKEWRWGITRMACVVTSAGGYIPGAPFVQCHLHIYWCIGAEPWNSNIRLMAITMLSVPYPPHTHTNLYSNHHHHQDRCSSGGRHHSSPSIDVLYLYFTSKQNIQSISMNKNCRTCQLEM